MLDRMTVTIPQWQERNPSDIGVMLVELLAYTADRLSYFQDAVATEAYLGTARRRVSIRRHARLLDYPMHDGCNARAWLTLEVNELGNNQKLLGPDINNNRPGTRFYTRVAPLSEQFTFDDYPSLVNSGVQIFETMHEITLYRAHNQINFYTWDAQEYYLKAGATKATLENKNLKLQVGDVLIFEEIKGVDTGLTIDADRNQRHVVRLTKVTKNTDPLHENKELLEIEWAAEDALPFALCVATIIDDKPISNISVARGNVVLVDHGCTVQELLPEVPEQGRYRPRLQFGPLTQQAYAQNRKRPFNLKAPAVEALEKDMRYVLPQIWLQEIAETGKRKLTLTQMRQISVLTSPDPGSSPLPTSPLPASYSIGKRWRSQRDLLNSDSFAREFVVETEEDGRAYLRFGDGVLGKEPEAQTQFLATYRIGNGTVGNVAAEAINQIDRNSLQLRQWVETVRNPLPARGGVEPEDLEQVRLYAPQAFRIQKRAVTEEDYATIAQRFPGVRKAVATRRWTGSWYTIFITVDRESGKPVDDVDGFKSKLGNFLESYRLVGQDIRIDGPIFVPLDIAMTVKVAPSYFNSQVKEELLNVFSNRVLRNGQLGFFHPDNFTFAQPVFLSQVIATAMQVTGVLSVKVKKFQRWNLEKQSSEEEIKAGQISFGRLEIALLENDPNTPTRGKIEFLMEGGL
ncbi:putative baseplate assembly protein [Tolypothrix sp. FACHB-123]|nr:putative baseplate assembly protein [Tolypothrix sp. FACHB-123]